MGTESKMCDRCLLPHVEHGRNQDLDECVRALAKKIQEMQVSLHSVGRQAGEMWIWHQKY